MKTTTKAAIGVLATFSTALLASCTSTPPPLRQDHAYVVEWIGERPLIDSSHLTVTLGSDGRAYGNAGCNHWFAPYHLDGTSLTFGPPGSTRKLCAPALMEQEHRFLQAIALVQRWDLSDIKQTRFWPATGAPLRLWEE